MDKILFVISYLDKGGSERALSNITLNFPGDYEIDILVNSDRVIDYPYKANIISMGLDMKPKTSSVLFQLKVLFKRLSYLRKLKRTGKYKACISFLDSANIANILTGSKYCKTICSVRNSLKKKSSQPQYKYVVNPLVRSLYNKADKVIACSYGVEKELTSIFKLKSSKVETIENGYDINQIISQAKDNPEPELCEKLKDKKVFVTTGRLSGQKGQWHLIRAFSEVIKDIPDAMLLIIGEGELEGYLKTLTKDYGLLDNIIFTGYTRNPFKYEKMAKVFVLPSLYEGFPNALAEGLCLGLNCVATDFETGSREILWPDADEYKSSNKLSKATKVTCGIMSPVCSGKKLEADVPLEKEEIELSRAMQMSMEMALGNENAGKAIDKAIIEERIKNLSIKGAVEKWVYVINE